MLSGPIGTPLPDGNFGVIPFANDSYFITAGKSSYNSLQVNFRHTSQPAPDAPWLHIQQVTRHCFRVWRAN